MPEIARTLVKSPPELWAEISDVQTLARRLSAFGEVRITRMDPETTVAWEGASVRGTVGLAASGWGTKVTITAEREQDGRAPAEQDTVAFDSAALAGALEEKPAPDPAAAPEPIFATSASADPEATGTDIPPQDAGPAPREGFLARLKGWWHTGRWAPLPPALAPQRQSVAEDAGIRRELQPIALEAPEVEPTVRAEPAAAAPPAPAHHDPELEGLLVAVLDDLGSAHHRPFSRA